MSASPDPDATIDRATGQTMAQDQQDIAAFLSDPATHNMKTAPIRIETHGSIVVLAEDNAYKIKRAVSYPYMDFSTLAKRRAACEAEILVNQKNAPSVYLGTIPITRDPEGVLTLGGNGTIIEWVVHMRRFDEQATLDHLAENGTLTQNIIDDLARVVSKSHAVAPAVRSWDSVAHMQKVISQISGELERRCGTGSTFLPNLYCRLQAAFDQQKQLICARTVQGFVRRCHGDLHLRNIAMIDGRPVLFDAIEFDPALATIDTLYDISFLIMDLCHRNLQPLACRLLTRYLWLSAEEDQEITGLALLPLFLALRACIRAEVLAAQAQLATSENVSMHISAYLNDALALLQTPAVQIIAIGGFSGSGKSLISDLLAPRLGAAPGAVQVRSDIERKRRFGVLALTRLGTDAYTPAVSQDVYGTLMRLTGLAVGAKRSAIVDATFLQASSRRQIEELARQDGATFTGVWLDAPVDVLRSRVMSRSNDPSDATLAVLDRQLCEDKGMLGWHRIDAAQSPNEVLEQILAIHSPETPSA